MELTRSEALNTCIKRAGSQAQLARDLGITPAAITKWTQSTKQMGVRHVLRAEELYNVSRHHLRPDFYPYENHPADSH